MFCMSHFGLHADGEIKMSKRVYKLNRQIKHKSVKMYLAKLGRVNDTVNPQHKKLTSASGTLMT